jgi:hypothetical protein
MSPLAFDLERIIGRLDSETAALLERAVRDALALAERRVSNVGEVDALGYPLGYFEATAASFANEPLERPGELPQDARESW